MAGLFESGRIVDLVLMFMVLEAGGLILLRRRTRRGIPPVDLLVSFAAGAALLFALRGALTRIAWPGIAVWLLLALLAHLLDLRRRWAAA